MVPRDRYIWHLQARANRRVNKLIRWQPYLRVISETVWVRFARFSWPSMCDDIVFIVLHSVPGGEDYSRRNLIPVYSFSPLVHDVFGVYPLQTMPPRRHRFTYLHRSCRHVRSQGVRLHALATLTLCHTQTRYMRRPYRLSQNNRPGVPLAFLVKN